MDELDLKIVKELKKNAQTPFLQIAERLGVSSKTVQTRYKEMKKEGIILRPTVTLDVSKIGWCFKAYFFITNSADHDSQSNIDIIKQMKNVVLVTETLGDCDLFVIMLLRNLEDLSIAIQDLRTKLKVEKTDFALVNSSSYPADKAYDRLPLELPKL